MIVSKELRAEIRNRRQLETIVNGKRVPGSIPFLRELLISVDDDDDRDDLLVELAGEYLRANLDDEHLLVQRERVANHPEAAVVWLALAHSLSMREDGVDEARQAVDKGLEISRSVGTLIRHALICRADVARKINDSTLFQQTLKELIADASNFRDEDSGLSDSVVANLPHGFCAQELVEEYRRLLNQRE